MLLCYSAHPGLQKASTECWIREGWRSSHRCVQLSSLAEVKPQLGQGQGLQHQGRSRSRGAEPWAAMPAEASSTAWTLCTPSARLVLLCRCTQAFHIPWQQAPPAPQQLRTGPPSTAGSTGHSTPAAASSPAPAQAFTTSYTSPTCPWSSWAPCWSLPSAHSRVTLSWAPALSVPQSITEKLSVSTETSWSHLKSPPSPEDL